ncbi:MAG: hypothetical protein ACJ8FY_12420 [Gemmataceae bacterium]
MPCSPEEAKQLREVSQLCSTLNQIAEHAEKDFARVEAVQTKTTEALQEPVVKVTAIEASVKTLEKNADKGGDRRFSIWQGILFVLVASVLAFAANVGLTYLKAYLEQKH